MSDDNFDEIGLATGGGAYHGDYPITVGNITSTINSTETALVQATPSLNLLSKIIHQKNVDAGWWTDLATGVDLRGVDEQGRPLRNIPELLMLVVSEVAEAMEGVRKNLKDDKLPHRSMFEVELADVFIRIFDIAGAHNLDLSGAVLEKLTYNANREDHKIANRLKEDGKKF